MGCKFVQFICRFDQIGDFERFEKNKENNFRGTEVDSASLVRAIDQAQLFDGDIGSWTAQSMS